MIYSGDTDGQDIVSLSNDLCDTSNLTYPIAEKTRAANKSLRNIWSWIFEAYGGWQYDDSNNTTNFPDATTTLNISQKDYDLPTEALTIRSVEVKNNGASTWYPLIPLTEELIIQQGLSENALYTSTGTPIYYTLEGSSINIYPSSSYTQSGSLRVSFDRGSTAFSTTSTTQQPGFASEFHEAVAVGIAMEWAKRASLPSYRDLQQEFSVDYKNRIQDYYSKKYGQYAPTNMAVYDTLRLMN